MTVGADRCARGQISFTQGAGKKEGAAALLTNLIILIHQMAAMGTKGGPTRLTKPIFHI